MNSTGIHHMSDEADQWRSRAGELAGWTDYYLVNRRDRFGHYVAAESRTDPDRTAYTDKSELTSEVLARHYKGESTGHLIGLHSTVRDEENGQCWCRWLAIDIDRHDDKTDPDVTRRAAIAWHDRAADLGFSPLLLDSNGDGGYHLIIIFEAFVRSETVYAFGQWITRDWKTLGLEGSPETFPKQPSISPGGSGNWIRLPGRHHTRDHYTAVWSGDTWLRGSEAIEFIRSTPGTLENRIPAEALEKPKPKPKSAKTNGQSDPQKDYALASKALDYLEPSMDYSEWLEVGMALQGLGRDGLELWDRWSSASDKYREGECDRKWRTFGRASNLVTLGTLFHRAKSRGFEFPRAMNGSPPAINGRVREPDGPIESGPGEGPRNRGNENLNLTDLGNGERMVRAHGEKIHYCHPWEKWLVWDGRRWRADDTASVKRMAHRTVRSIYAEASYAEADDVRKATAAWAKESEKRARTEAMIWAASWMEGTPVLPEQLDQNPWLLNCQNGTLDLKSGVLRPHDPADMITKMAPVDYDPDAICPLFMETLRTFLVTDELIEFWQRLCGMAATGVIEDHILPIAYGTGSNGKSTILGALIDVFGADYAMKAAPDFLVARKQDGHPTDRADLFGKRIVVAIETEDGQRLNETMVKEMTGGDRIRARRMREDFWEFSPTHTIFLATNHMPTVRGTDHGIWRRLKLIPFVVEMSDDKARKDVPQLLLEESPGILAWMVRGCLLWQKDGLQTPASVANATSEYRKEEDLLGGFINEECVISGSLRVKSSALYARYKAWAERTGEYAITSTKFGKSIHERGFKGVHSGGKFYSGLGLRAEPEENSGDF